MLRFFNHLAAGSPIQLARPVRSRPSHSAAAVGPLSTPVAMYERRVVPHREYSGDTAVIITSSSIKTHPTLHFIDRVVGSLELV